MRSELRQSRFGATGFVVVVAGLAAIAAIAAPAGQPGDDRHLTISTAAPLPDALGGGGSDGGVAGPCPASSCSLSGCTLTQSLDPLTNGGNQVACGIAGVGTTENGWARCYNRASEGLPSSDSLRIDGVTFGVQQATADGINVNVNLYLDNDGCPPQQPGLDAQLLASVPLVVNMSDAGTFMTADFTTLAPVWPPGPDLVVEIEQVVDGTETEPTFSFRPMSNAGGQCGPSYIRAVDCGFPNWGDIAQPPINFPNTHLLQVVSASFPVEQDMLTTCFLPNGLVFGGPDVPAIPEGFFDPGSDPFFGSIQYVGVPLDVVSLGDVDTIVQRPGPPILPQDPIGTQELIPIEIVSLNLVSVQPITVTYPLDPPQLWDITITLSNVHPPQGFVNAFKTHVNGGTFDAFLPVQPRFTFTRVDSPFDERIIDTGELGIPPLQLQIVTAPWVHQVSPTIPLIQPPAPWVPGILELVPGDLNSQVETPFTARSPFLTVEHTVCPGTVKEERCEVVSNTIPRNQSACTTTVNADGTRNVRVTFEMNSSFRANVTCCEYRQKVKGEFTYNGKKLVHTMNPGVILDKDELREDGFGVPTPAGSNPNYGHRDAPNNPAHDRYGNPGNRGAGAEYHGTDAPGLSNIPAGRTYNIDLSFEGKIIDVCNGTDVRTHTWDVDCAGTALGTGGPLVEVITETVINGRNGLLAVALYPGNELTVDAALANFFGEVPIDASEVDVDVTGLLLTDFPDPGPLPETRVGGAMAQALFDFDYPPGSPDPVHVTLTYGPETQEFDVDLPPIPCPSDLDGNGIVGINDLLTLLANWGNPYGINDLLDLLAAWGPC